MKKTRSSTAHAAQPAAAATPSQGLDLAFAVILGTLSLWRLFEMDVFWCLRAGQEIWRTGTIPMVESWSFTVPGTPWLNTHWLTEAVTYSGYAVGGYAGVVMLRGIAIGLLSWLVLQAVRAFMPRREPWIEYALAVAVWVASAYRLELRGELFVLIAFTAVLWLSASAHPRRAVYTGLLVWLSANFHAGQGVMVLALAVWMAASELLERPRELIATCVAYGAAFFVTPVHYKALTFMYDHLFYKSVLDNPDHSPFKQTMLDFATHEFAASYWLWLALVGAAALSLVRLTTNAHRPPIRPWVLSLLLFVLVALSFNRVRAVPFSSVLAACIAATYWRPAMRWQVAVASLIVAAALGWTLKHSSHSYGFDVDARVFPVRAAEFVEREKPAQNLHHTFTFGAYFVWALQDYKLFGDTRETPFKSVSELYLSAYQSSAVSQSLYERYSVNSMVMPIPKTAYIEGIGYRDVVAEYTPADQWATVYFDDMAMVNVRRIPENQRIIDQYEYKTLRPHIPADWLAGTVQSSPERRAVFDQELDRCLRQVPAPRWCVLARSSAGPGEPGPTL